MIWKQLCAAGQVFSRNSRVYILIFKDSEHNILSPLIFFSLLWSPAALNFSFGASLNLAFNRKYSDVPISYDHIAYLNVKNVSVRNAKSYYLCESVCCNRIYIPTAYILQGLMIHIRKLYTHFSKYKPFYLFSSYHINFGAETLEVLF